MCFNWTVTAVLVVLAIGGLVEAQFEDIPPGDYCGGTSTVRCCDGRVDECSVPLLGSLCYCDQFCNRTNSHSDCCPDYFSACLGITPPDDYNKGECYHDGQKYAYGSVIQVNCNKCECRHSLADSSRTEFLCETNTCLVEADIITGVNTNANAGWKAANYSTLWGRKLEEGFLLRLGTLEPERFVSGMNPIMQRYDENELPISFDGRLHWTNWLQGVRDQGWCGASWAFSTAAVASDRFAIQSGGNRIYPLSVQNLLACNNRGQQGCKGGHLDRAWNYMRRYGVVNDECYPYVSGQTGKVNKCKVGRRSNLLTLGCQLTKSGYGSGRDESATSSQKSLFKTLPAYRISPRQFDIMNEIRQRGPVQATMKVHQDFFMYQSGIYRYTGLGEARQVGYHSVRIVGWGEDSYRQTSSKYWVVANSWGEEWGEDGYFRIARGENESEIENFVLAAWAADQFDY